MRWTWTLLLAGAAAGVQPSGDPQASTVLAARGVVAIRPAEGRPAPESALV